MDQISAMGRTVEPPETQPVPAGTMTSVQAPADDQKHPAHRIRVAQCEVDGVSTDVLLQAFDDRIFVSVTQLQKLGTIVRLSHFGWEPLLTW